MQLEIAGQDPAGYFEIFDIAGQRIMKQDLSGNSLQEFDLTSQPNGNYFIRVRNGDEVGVQQFIKE